MCALNSSRRNNWLRAEGVPQPGENKGGASIFCDRKQMRPLSCPPELIEVAPRVPGEGLKLPLHKARRSTDEKPFGPWNTFGRGAKMSPENDLSCSNGTLDLMCALLACVFVGGCGAGIYLPSGKLNDRGPLTSVSALPEIGGVAAPEVIEGSLHLMENEASPETRANAIRTSPITDEEKGQRLARLLKMGMTQLQVESILGSKSPLVFANGPLPEREHCYPNYNLIIGYDIDYKLLSINFLESAK